MNTSKTVTLLLIVLAFSIKSVCQTNKIDSLEKWVAKYPKKDTVWLKNLIELERAYYIQEPQKLGKYAAEIINISKKLNFPSGTMSGYKIKAQHHIKNGKYDEATQAVFEKLKYDQLTNNISERIVSYSLLGRIYSLLENKEGAIKYYTFVLDEVKKLPSSFPSRVKKIVGHSSNLAIAYTDAKKYNEALTFLLQGYTTLKKIKERDKEYYYLLVSVLTNIGNTYNFLEKFELSNKYLQEGINNIIKQNIQVGLSRIYLTFCNNYIELKQFEKANEILSILKIFNNKNELDSEEVLLYNKLITKLKVEQKDFEGAYLSLKKEVAHKDSLKTNQQQKTIQELTIKYETKVKDAQIKDFQKEKELNDVKNKLYVGSIVTLLILLIGAAASIIQIRKAKQKVEKANALRDKLFAIVTHDLRSPVASLRQITAKTAFILKKDDPVATQLLTHSIENAANSLYQLVDNLLHWSLLKQNKVKYQPQNFVVEHEIAEVIQSLNYRIVDKKIELTTAFDKTLTVSSDRIFVQTIVRNLLDNAIKHSPNNGKIAVLLTSEKEFVFIKITDSGKGMPKDIQESIFKEQINHPISIGTAGEKGKGIGLYLCCELAQVSGGDIYIVSSSSLGTTMVYKLLKA